MQPIYSRNGVVTGWLDEYLVLGSDGRCRGYIARNRVFDLRGRHIGYLEDSLVCDRLGEMVAFLQGAAPGFALPPLSPSGPPPCLTLPQSFPKLEDAMVSRLLFSTPMQWSALDWDAFLRS